jgi:hypothetical protein
MSTDSATHRGIHDQIHLLLAVSGATPYFVHRHVVERDRSAPYRRPSRYQDAVAHIYVPPAAHPSVDEEDLHDDVVGVKRCNGNSTRPDQRLRARSLPEIVELIEGRRRTRLCGNCAAYLGTD